MPLHDVKVGTKKVVGNGFTYLSSKISDIVHERFTIEIYRRIISDSALSLFLSPYDLSKYRALFFKHIVP